MIRKMGFVDYFLIVSDFIAYAKNQRHPRGAGPGLGRRLHGVLLPEHHRPGPGEVQPVLRALPEPGAGDHARYRHRLLHPPPPGGHRLCLPEVRRRPRGSDRHLRHHGGPGRRSGCGPGAEHDLRRGGRHRQADPQRTGGPPHHPGGIFEAVQAAQGRLRRKSPGEKAHRHRQGHRGHAPEHLHPRRRRGHHQPAGERLCAPGQERRPGGHPVHHDHPGGAGPA